jgi:hypothetical protein
MTSDVVVFNPYEPAFSTALTINNSASVQSKYRNYVRAAGNSIWPSSLMYVHELYDKEHVRKGTYFVVTYVLRTNHHAIYALDAFCSLGKNAFRDALEDRRWWTTWCQQLTVDQRQAVQCSFLQHMNDLCRTKLPPSPPLEAKACALSVLASVSFDELQQRATIPKLSDSAIVYVEISPCRDGRQAMDLSSA